MVNLTVNNIGIIAPEGSTVLEAAKEAGFKIPTLCHNDSLPHYSSCMVCMVLDKRSASFLPSCSALVQEGMDIDISGENVISLRKKAVELLLSEHRAECEAPCKVVCPAGYNIPLMNRLLSARDYEAAFGLSKTQINSSGLKCIDCPGYCENACRRKKIDTPVSIRNMQLFISQQIKQNDPYIGSYPQKDAVSKLLKGQFISRIGKLETFELKEWLKECKDDIKRVRDIIDQESASCESESCMHCDCRAVDNCRLRDIADEFSIKDPRGKIVNSPIEKKININTGLVFENAKCIKCGLCVRLCEDSKDEPALCYINRGFISIIAEPLTEDFNDILKLKTKEVIDICPTGALSQF
jgi:predicted molibdopterin-dependent oxidoreductase YjgC